MKARAFIEGSSLNPRDAELVLQAFEQIWAKVGMDHLPKVADETRQNLAKMTLDVVACHGCTSIDAIVGGVMLQLGYPPDVKSVVSDPAAAPSALPRLLPAE